MSDVREAISDYIMNHVAINPSTRFADLTWGQTDHAAGDILALIREALLADDAQYEGVKAAEVVYHDGDRDWHAAMRAATETMLDAAGITEADDDDA